MGKTKNTKKTSIHRNGAILVNSQKLYFKTLKMSEIDQNSVCPPLIIRTAEKSPIDTITLGDSEDLFAEDDEPVEVIDELDICQFIERNDLPNTSLSSLEPDFFQDSQEIKDKSIEILDSQEITKQEKSIEIVDLEMELTAKPKKKSKLDEDYEWNNDRSSHFYNITLQKSLPLGIYDKRLKPFESEFEKEVHKIALENSKRTRSVARKLENISKEKSPSKKSPFKKFSEIKEKSPVKKSSETKEFVEKSSETKENSPAKKSSDAKETKVQKKSEPSEFDKEIQKLVKQKNKSIRGAKRKPKIPSRFE